MADTPAFVEVIDSNELAALRLAAERYQWLRNHHIRIQGSEMWYAGAALDVRVDVGRDHVAEQARDITLKKPAARKRRLK